MMMIGKRTIAVSIRFGVHQSTLSLCGASIESVVYILLSFMYKTMWFIMFRYVINTAMVHLRFVYLCVRLFLGHIWVFYASYFVLKIWVWQIASNGIRCFCCKSVVLVTLGGCHLLDGLVACDSIEAHYKIVWCSEGGFMRGTVLILWGSWRATLVEWDVKDNKWSGQVKC